MAYCWVPVSDKTVHTIIQFLHLTYFKEYYFISQCSTKKPINYSCLTYENKYMFIAEHFMLCFIIIWFMFWSGLLLKVLVSFNEHNYNFICGWLNAFIILEL
jgi:hypothetical protein